MNKIPITIRLGEDIRAEAFHHFLLIGFDFPEDGTPDAEAGKIDLGVVQSTADPMILLHGIQTLANQLAQSEAADARVMGTAIQKTIDHGLQRLHGQRARYEEKDPG